MKHVRYFIFWVTLLPIYCMDENPPPQKETFEQKMKKLHEILKRIGEEKAYSSKENKPAP